MPTIKRHGGIQTGSTATSKESKKLDRTVRIASKLVEKELFERYGVIRQSKLTKEQIPFGVGACQPDGGIWFRNNIPIMAIEAKYQLHRGNGIERWYNNHAILRHINKNISYLTFASGTGVIVGNPIWKTLHFAVEGSYDVYRPYHNTVFLSVDGFSLEYVCEHIISLLALTIEGK